MGFLKPVAMSYEIWQFWLPEPDTWDSDKSVE
jgi:hypothetical protein